MLRRTVFVLAVVLAGAVAVPARANHSTPTGKNCPDFTYQEEAQEYFDAHPGDPEGLDGPIGPGFTGVQNVACENLPSRPGVQPAAQPIAGPTTSTTVASDTRIIPVTTTTTLRPVAPATARSAPQAATPTRRAIALTG